MHDELQELIKTAQNNGFWARITVAKSIELQEIIQKLTAQQQKMDTRQNELRKYLATSYEDKVKGVMDGGHLSCSAINSRSVIN